jgi:hypothetical protein
MEEFNKINKFTNFNNRQGFLAELTRVSDKFVKNYTNIESLITQNLILIDKNNSYHFLNEILKPDLNNKIEVNICRLLSKTMHQSELLACDASRMVFAGALLALEKILRNEKLLNTILHKDDDFEQSLEQAMRKIKEAIQNCASIPTKNTIKSQSAFFAQFTTQGTEQLHRVCIEAVELAGLEGKIFIKNGTQNNHYILELKDGYTFDLLESFEMFSQQPSGGVWEKRECKALVVDGFVEKVSEIDQLLNVAYETKQPMIIVSQGFSEEVVSTLFTNWRQEKLQVLPIKLKQDIDSLNVINDIGAVCGMEPISYLRGELSKYIKFENLPTIDRITVAFNKKSSKSKHQVSFENNKTKKAVFAQIKALSEKREQNKFVEDVQGFMDNRIKSLSPNSVYFYLPNESPASLDQKRIIIDTKLRQIKGMFNYGVVDSDDWCYHLTRDYLLHHSGIYSMAENEFEEIFFKFITEIFFDIRYGHSFSSLAVYVGLLLGIKLGFSLISSGGIITTES